MDRKAIAQKVLSLVEKAQRENFFGTIVFKFKGGQIYASEIIETIQGEALKRLLNGEENQK